MIRTPRYGHKHTALGLKISHRVAVYVGNFFVDSDKFGHYRYVLKNIGSAPAFIGESYDNRPQCEKIIESVKNFVVSASIVKENEDNG